MTFATKWLRYSRLTTRLNLIGSRLDCNRVNTCEWDAANSHCQYNAAKFLAKAGKRH
jgi:hypothetical protein